MNVRRFRPQVDDTIPTRLRQSWGEEDEGSTEHRVFNDDPTSPEAVVPVDNDPTDRVPLDPDHSGQPS